MADLEEVYAGKTETVEVQAPEVEVTTGEEQSVPPTPETPTIEPEVNWRERAEQAQRTAEEAERRAKGLEQAIAAARAKVREQPEPSFNEDPEKFVQRIRQEMQEEFKPLRVESAQAAARGKYADYNEKEDLYYWPEGWYEWNRHEETHWRVGETVTHWMALPLPFNVKFSGA